jgi:exo-beta-1,3-glucanase (GH17 family)
MGRGAVWLMALALGAGAAHAEPVCARHEAAAPAIARLRAALSHGRFIAYQPTSLALRDGHLTRADAATIRADLKVLRPRFDALLTYGAVNGAEAIPGIAAELGYRALVVGVWDPFDAGELAAALAAAGQYPKLVVGVSLGNELVLAKRATPQALQRQLRAVRARAPQVALSTSEPFHIYYQPGMAPLLGELDFLLANVHPVFQPWFRSAPDANAAAFVLGVVDELAQRYCGPILVKETGVPSAPAEAGYTAARQASFYRALRAAFAPTPNRAFAYFASFDAPWRVADMQASPGVHPEEAHWGLYDERRRPKPVVLEIPPLSGAGRGGPGDPGIRP